MEFLCYIIFMIKTLTWRLVRKSTVGQRRSDYDFGVLKESDFLFQTEWALRIYSEET